MADQQTFRQRPLPAPRSPASGLPASRVEGRLKVTGAARYGSDFYGGPNPAHAYLVTSRIARGPNQRH